MKRKEAKIAKARIVMNKGLLIVVSGPSGSGKGEITRRLRDSGEFEFSVSATTRAPRFDEKDGVAYHFISKEKFENDIKDGKFLEYTEYVNNYYGTYLSQVEKALSNGINIILEIEVLGAKQIKEKMPESISILILPPSKESLENRLRNRKTETEEQISLRLERAKYELSYFDDYDYVVVSEDGQIEKAVDDIKKIVYSEKFKTFRNKEIKSNFIN